MGLIMQLVVEDGSDNNDMKGHPKVTELLLQFAEVFEEPKGLPPKRSYDHTIVLKEGV